MNTLRGVRKAALVLAALLAPGCGRLQNAADQAKKSNDLKVLGLMYHNYCNDHPKGPTSPDDLKTVSSGAQDDAVVQMVKDGKYVLIWGTTIAAMGKNPQGTGGTVLGYETTTPTGGGLVLMGDGSVKKVTAAEFASLPKAEPVSQ